MRSSFRITKRLNIRRRFLVVGKCCYASITYDYEKIDITFSIANHHDVDEAGDARRLNSFDQSYDGSRVTGEG